MYLFTRDEVTAPKRKPLSLVMHLAELQIYKIRADHYHDYLDTSKEMTKIEKINYNGSR